MKHGKPIKEFLKKQGISHRLLLTLKKHNSILVNQKTVFTNYLLNADEIIILDLNYAEESDNIIPTAMPLSIIYEDEALLILNKPAGIPVHPSLHYYENSLSNGVKYYFTQIGLNKKIRPVNRLDKDTSGLVLFAKNEYVQECLIKQMQTKDFVKEYIALITGHLTQKSGTICASIARKSNSIIERVISPNGEVAITHYTRLKNFSDFSLVRFTLETGRTHQIRVHAKFIGHPLLGDTLYGNSSPLIHRQALHAFHITFFHPITHKMLSFYAPLPDDMKNILKCL